MTKKARFYIWFQSRFTYFWESSWNSVLRLGEISDLDSTLIESNYFFLPVINLLGKNKFFLSFPGFFYWAKLDVIFFLHSFFKGKNIFGVHKYFSIRYTCTCHFLVHKSSASTSDGKIFLDSKNIFPIFSFQKHYHFYEKT